MLKLTIMFLPFIFYSLDNIKYTATTMETYPVIKYNTKGHKIDDILEHFFVIPHLPLLFQSQPFAPSNSLFLSC